MNSETGKWIIVAGVFIVIAGIIVYFFYDKFNWLGHLPGDVRIEKENFRFYFPFTTLILISVVVSVIIQIIKRLM